MGDPPTGHRNRLADEPSLYLRQHGANPVDWYPWGDEAFARARAEDKPILLSIGYSSCHWCHVMAHESFEDDEVAALMNRHFVNVKVDREERPDIDSIYMDAVQAMAGHGGWPLTAFLTPDGKAFWGGTYFPKLPRQGMPGFMQVLEAIHETWNSERDNVTDVAGRIATQLAATPTVDDTSPATLDPTIPEQAANTLLAAYDRSNAGFERAPKFPAPMAIELLLRVHVRTGRADVLDAATQTLDRMLWGGMYDQVGGGFHRYSVDAFWLVPHFEKMLYDNAQLACAYTWAWQLSGRANFRRAAEETLDWMLREMRNDDGTIAASQDADSEGVEGRFYAWSIPQLTDALGTDDARWVADLYRATEEGNFEEAGPAANVLSLASEPTEQQWSRLGPLRDTLRDARARRVPPATDPKAVAAWNGLALRALAAAGMVFADEPRWSSAAVELAEAIERTFMRRDGRQRYLVRTPTAAQPAFCEDYACIAAGMLAAYELTFDTRWYLLARSLARTAVEQFSDPASGAFFATGPRHEQLVHRPIDLADHPTPSATSMMAQVLARLAQYEGDPSLATRAELAASIGAPRAVRMPGLLAAAANAADMLVGAPRELAIALPKGTNPDALLAPARATYRPNLAVAVARSGKDAEAIPLLAGRDTLDSAPTAYLCTRGACRLPTTDPDELARELG